VRDGDAGKSMSADTVYPAWEVDQHRLAQGELPAAARDGRLGEPQLLLAIQTDRGDTISVPVVQEAVPSAPGSLLYVRAWHVQVGAPRALAGLAGAAPTPGVAGAIGCLPSTLGR